MADYKYSFPAYNSESMARAVGRDLPISTKQAIEVCNSIRKKNLLKAKAMLENVIKKKQPIEFRRFTNGLGHRKGNLTSGRYPIKTSGNILTILNSAEVNGQQKGLNTSKLSIIHVAAKKASGPMRFGRHRGRQAKRTHIEVVLGEVEDSKARKGSTVQDKETKADKQKKNPEKEKAQEKAAEDKKEEVTQKPAKEENQKKDGDKKDAQSRSSEKEDKSKEKTEPKTSKPESKGGEKK
ncbi:50S ribosomal protein L22 [Candidatus Woesearchaeota archaeon]|nr:50S ribosomal protein L22 [Candidatus Woesearchaeota archaeon]